MNITELVDLHNKNALIYMPIYDTYHAVCDAAEDPNEAHKYLIQSLSLSVILDILGQAIVQYTNSGLEDSSVDISQMVIDQLDKKFSELAI